MPATPLDALKSWEGIPAAIVSGLVPWLAPFRHLDIINTLWRPAIDIVADGVLVLFVLWLMLRGGFASRKRRSRVRAFIRSLIAALALALLCFLIRAYLIHWVDPAIEPLVSLFWGACYILMFVAIARMVFAGLATPRGEPAKKKPSWPGTHR